jgi:AcrR family transcriptional regulator
MTRLSRVESQAVTRARLVAAARELFRKQGYATTSVDRIAEAAGYSKGAVYSNFENKEAIFLAVLEAQAQESLNELLARIERAAGATAVVKLMADWADDRSRSGSWTLTLLEHARLAGIGSPSVRRQEEIIRGQWRQLGTCLVERFPGIAEDAETLGALLLEIAYAPAMTFVSTPTAGALIRLAMTGILRSKN